MDNRFYLFGKNIGIDEDESHEFKSHRSLCTEEMPPWTTVVDEGTGKIVRSRQPVSKTVVAFLNTGRGGVCYLGVQNDGIIEGLKLTPYQKDHIVVSMYDILERYTPKVEPSQVQIAFVPVLSAADEEMPKEATDYHIWNEGDERRTKKAHSLRTPAYCWCDKDALARYNMCLLPLSYVVEITVKPWNGTSHSRLPDIPLPPIYQNEQGLAYIRRLASNIQIGVQEVRVVTENQIHNYYDEEIERLEKELDDLQKVAYEKLCIDDQLEDAPEIA